MKTNTLTVLACALLLIVPVFSGDDCCESKAASIQQRIREIDVNVALKQYEEIQTEKAKAEIQVILLETESGNDKEHDIQTERLRNRVHVLSRHAAEIKARMIELTKEVAVAAK